MKNNRSSAVRGILPSVIAVAIAAAVAVFVSGSTLQRSHPFSFSPAIASAPVSEKIQDRIEVAR